MVRQQEIRNALLDPVLVPAVRAHQPTLADLRLEQQRVQLGRHLRVLGERGAGRGRGGESGKA